MKKPAARKRLAYLVGYATYVAFLHAIPGPWRLWKGERARTLDPWTLQHVIWGALADAAGFSQPELLALGVANELVELLVRKFRPDLLWGTPETPANVGADLVAAALGHWIASSA